MVGTAGRGAPLRGAPLPAQVPCPFGYSPHCYESDIGGRMRAVHPDPGSRSYGLMHQIGRPGASRALATSAVTPDAPVLAVACIDTEIRGGEPGSTTISIVAIRHRPTDLAREIARRSAALSTALGQEVRTSRVRKSMTQGALSAKIGISQTALSRIERGFGGRTPLQTWIALGIALGRPLAVTFTRALGEGRGPSDAGHLEIQEHMLRLGRQTGRHGTFEVPTRPSDPARSTDVGLRDDRHRVLIQVECWNTFGDLGAAVRATQRKAAEAEAHAIATNVGSAPTYRVATVWVVRATAANRALLARFPNVIDAAFPGSSRRWCRALVDGTAPPAQPGIVWFDPATSRLLEHRRAR